MQHLHPRHLALPLILTLLLLLLLSLIFPISFSIPSVNLTSSTTSPTPIQILTIRPSRRIKPSSNKHNILVRILKPRNHISGQRRQELEFVAHGVDAADEDEAEGVGVLWGEGEA